MPLPHWLAQPLKQASVLIVLLCNHPGIHDDHHGNRCQENIFRCCCTPTWYKWKRAAHSGADLLYQARIMQHILMAALATVGAFRSSMGSSALIQT